MEYSIEEQRDAALDLKNLPSDSVLADMVVDYGRLRDQVRACQNRED